MISRLGSIFDRVDTKAIGGFLITGKKSELPRGRVFWFPSWEMGKQLLGVLRNVTLGILLV